MPADTPRDHYLIVDAAPAVAGLEELLATLAKDFDVDAYTARQRLLGRGLALFVRGSQERLSGVAGVLAAAGVRHWLIRPQKPRCIPDRLRRLEATEQALTLVGRQGELVVARGARLVAILADLSGRAVAKSLQRLVVQNAYRGGAAVEPMADDAFRREVLRGEPVLDLYLLDADSAVAGAMRLLPGRFDPAGLGERKSYSAAGNLAAALDLVEDYAGALEVRTDFGLANLPGCRLAKRGESPAAERENLLSLTRFGWLATQLAAVPAPGPKPQRREDSATALGTLASPLFQAAEEVAGNLLPETGATDHAGPVPRREGPEENTEPGLPPPPDPASTGSAWHRRLLTAIGGGAGLTAMVILFLLEGGAELRQGLWRHGVQSGIVPGMLAAGLFCGGFYCLRLKHRIENTPTSRIRSLALGMVEVQGQARRRYALVAPMSQLPCVWYRLRRYRCDSRNRLRLVGLTASGPVPFSLEDDTGRVAIDPRGAAVRGAHREQGAPGRIGLLAGTSARDEPGETWIEDTIPEGTPLYVLGFAATRRRQRPTLRDRTIALLRRLKADPDALAAYDRNGDGRLDPCEWQTAREHMEDRALRESLAEKGQRETDPIVVSRPPQRGLPFVITATPAEEILTRRYGLLTAALLVGAALAAAWTLALTAHLFIPGY